MHAAALIITGGLILGIGMSSVFVSEDLGFLSTTAKQARELGERMIGLIAHHRATLGGLPPASGTAILLPVLWCFRHGEAWLWRSPAAAGVPAYGAAIGTTTKSGKPTAGTRRRRWSAWGSRRQGWGSVGVI